MKLYTEEQLRNSMLSMKTYIKVYNESVIDSIIEKHIKALGEFELPSDEEIWKEAPFSSSTFGFEQGQYQGFLLGAKWIKDKILNK